jgi:long-chain acyl-CoA synthetase
MRRRVAIVMSGETLENLHRGRNQGDWFLNLVAPLGYWAITALFNVFPLPPGAGFRRSFSHAGWAMDRGYHALIFPEGIRSPDGTLRPFRAGIGLLARESQAQILPVALVGLGELNQRKHSWRNWSWFRSGILRIRVGHPVPPMLEGPPEVAAESLRSLLASMLHK